MKPWKLSTFYYRVTQNKENQLQRKYQQKTVQFVVSKCQ